MSSFKISSVPLLLAMAGLIAGASQAHVRVEGPAFAGARQVLTFSNGHGCEGADTVSVQVHIPEAITSLRPLPSAWGEGAIERDAADLIRSVTWTKPEARAEDDHFYEFQIRITVPDLPFTTLYFPVTQTCRTPEGVETVVEWSSLPGGSNTEEPAAPLVILPPRAAGWNKYTAPVDITDLSFFDDAQIVWVGDAAYSSNPTTMELIARESNVSSLGQIAAGAEIWVKY